MKTKLNKKQWNTFSGVYPEDYMNINFELVTYKDEIMDMLQNNVVKDSKDNIIAFTIIIKNRDGGFNDNKRLREICHVLNGVGKKISDTEYHYTIKDNMGDLFIQLLNLAHFDN